MAEPQYLTTTKKKKKNNLLGGASAVQNISDLPEEDIGYTPGPSPVKGPSPVMHAGPEKQKSYVSDIPQTKNYWLKQPGTGTSPEDMFGLMTRPPEFAAGPPTEPLDLTPDDPKKLYPGMFDYITGAYSDQPTAEQKAVGSLIPEQPHQLTPAQKAMQERQARHGGLLPGTEYDPISEFDDTEYLTPSPITQPLYEPLTGREVVKQVGVGPGGQGNIPVGGDEFADTEYLTPSPVTGTPGILKPAVGTPATGALSAITADPQQPPTPIQVGGAGAPEPPGLDLISDPTGQTGGTVTQPPQQTQTPTPIQTGGAGAPDETIDLTPDPEGLAGGTVSTFPQTMTEQEAQDIFVKEEGGRDVGQAIVPRQSEEQKQAYIDQYNAKQESVSKLAAQTTAAKTAQTANFIGSPQFKNLSDWFAADEATRATMTNPLANLETVDTPILDALGNPITDPVTGEKQVSKELTPVSQDVLKTYGELLANEETRNQMARQYNISNLNDIGETIDPDTGERVPTDVALSRQTALANSLSSIAGQTFTPAEAAAYERGEVSEELKTKLDASWAQVQKEQEEQINQMKSNIKLTDANAAVKLAEVTKMEGDLQLAKDELAWRKDHSAAELAERQKARDAEMGRLQAELESVATREGQQRTHERELATQSQKHQMDMQRIEQQTAFATQAMNMLANNPSAIFALQTTPGLESLADLMGITRRPGAAVPGAPPQGMIPTLGTLQQGGQRAMQQAQTMAGIQQGLTPGEFAQQVRGVTPGGGFAPGVQQMTGITRTGRG